MFSNPPPNSQLRWFHLGPARRGTLYRTGVVQSTAGGNIDVRVIPDVALQPPARSAEPAGVMLDLASQSQREQIRCFMQVRNVAWRGASPNRNPLSSTCWLPSTYLIARALNNA